MERNASIAVRKPFDFSTKPLKTGANRSQITPCPASTRTPPELKVIGRASQDKESLGAWDHQQALYFWHADQLESHDRDKVKWTIEPAQANALIKSLSPVRVKNVHFTDKPYLAPYRHSSGTTYVTTTDDGITDSTVFEIILVK